MKAFAALLERLIFTPARNGKIDALRNYFARTPDPHRGYGLAVLTGQINIKLIKPAFLRDLTSSRVDPVLFGLSYDYVGDMAETISLIWPEKEEGELPLLGDLIDRMNAVTAVNREQEVVRLLNIATPNERWAILKVFGGNLRIGVSARLAKTALAEWSGKELQEIEEIWHGLTPPYENLFAWLEDRGEKPTVEKYETFHPMMLSNPIDEEKDFAKMDPADYIAEWKWDGIRVQVLLGEHTKRLFSRTGEDISHAFPDLLDNLHGIGVLDGELLVGRNFEALPFNGLQQRLNRKTVVKTHLEEYPAFLRAYDMLFDGAEDVRPHILTERKKRLRRWIEKHPSPRLIESDFLDFSSWEDLAAHRLRGAEEQGHEGIMIKKKDSIYEAGRPKGPWFKWKRDARLVDAIMMYAQRGHGKRSSFYSDYTFGVWKGNEIVPIGKAYSGFTDEELRILDKWIRDNTLERFGPVREVKKELVLEVAFDSAHESARHKSGVALRFPRINRIRWDKPAQEADTLDNVRKFVS
jgi:DNA ligase-1